jgi:hypothetical protein
MESTTTPRLVVVVVLLLLRTPTIGAFFWGGWDSGGPAVLVVAADHDTTADGDQQSVVIEQQRKNHHRFNQALDSMGSGRSRSSIRKVLMVLLFSSVSGNSTRPTVRKSTGRARVMGEANFIELSTIHSTWQFGTFHQQREICTVLPNANGESTMRCVDPNDFRERSRFSRTTTTRLSGLVGR